MNKKNKLYLASLCLTIIITLTLFPFIFQNFTYPSLWLMPLTILICTLISEYKKLNKMENKLSFNISSGIIIIGFLFATLLTTSLLSYTENNANYPLITSLISDYFKPFAFISLIANITGLWPHNKKESSKKSKKENKRYWLRGGIIACCLPFIWILSSALRNTNCDGIGNILQSGFPGDGCQSIGEYIGLVLEGFFTPSIAFLIIGFIAIPVLFGIGALIGIGYDKWKKRK